MQVFGRDRRDAGDSHGGLTLIYSGGRVETEHRLDGKSGVKCRIAVPNDVDLGGVRMVQAAEGGKGLAELLDGGQTVG